ncbi:unnamed protein product [Amoebophrya sp. A25]|nr:unnamed protein product [Amoebophrya sp. A25]|eukprot:GSA25T00007193001.1
MELPAELLDTALLDPCHWIEVLAWRAREQGTTTSSVEVNKDGIRHMQFNASLCRLS